MNIDKSKIKGFWENQANKLDKTNESVSNLEEDEGLLKLKVELEKKKVMPILEGHLTKNSRVLDLGAGTGQWAFRFSSRYLLSAFFCMKIVGCPKIVFLDQL